MNFKLHDKVTLFRGGKVLQYPIESLIITQLFSHRLRLSNGQYAKLTEKVKNYDIWRLENDDNIVLEMYRDKDELYIQHSVGYVSKTDIMPNKNSVYQASSINNSDKKNFIPWHQFDMHSFFEKEMPFIDIFKLAFYLNMRFGPGKIKGQIDETGCSIWHLSSPKPNIFLQIRSNPLQSVCDNINVFISKNIFQTDKLGSRIGNTLVPITIINNTIRSVLMDLLKPIMIKNNPVNCMGSITDLNFYDNFCDPIRHNEYIVKQSEYSILPQI